MGFEVAYDPNQNLQIVKCIKKYPVLYNTKKYPPIEYRGVIDKVWETVAEELGVSEGYCKSRWTNIKGCYKRFLRTKMKKQTVKSYYLAPYLKFVYPFINIDGKSFGQNNDHVSQESNSEDEENLTIDETPTVETDMGRSALEVKLVVDDDDRDGESYIIPVTNIHDAEYGDQDSFEDNPDWRFLTSLLPEVHSMNPAQKSKFRNAILSSIDTVLYGEEFI